MPAPGQRTASSAGNTKRPSSVRVPRRTLAIGAAMAVVTALVTVFAVSVFKSEEGSARSPLAVPGSTSSTGVHPGVVPVATAQQLACNPTPPNGVPVTGSSPAIHVTALQWGLTNLGYGITGEAGAPPLPVTGVFDDVTAQAIGRFQQAGRSLPPTRIGDAATWAEMSTSLQVHKGINRC